MKSIGTYARISKLEALRLDVIEQGGFPSSVTLEASPLHSLQEVVHLLLFASAAVVVCLVDCAFSHEHGDLSHACSAGSASTLYRAYLGRDGLVEDDVVHVGHV